MFGAVGLLSIYQSGHYVRQAIIECRPNSTNLFPLYSTPETFDIVSQTIDIPVRKNLSQISRVLTQITRGEEFGEDSPCYVPINDFVKKATKQITSWLVNGMCDVTIRELRLIILLSR